MTTKIPVELSSTPGIVDGSNATAITIDSSENVGIGTTSPLTKFHVHNSSDAENILIVTGADTTTEYISLGTSGGVGVLKSGHSGASATSLAFETAASNGSEIERMRITSVGDVCIGGTNDVHTGSDIGPTLHILSETSGTDVSLHLHPDTGEYSLYAYNGYLAILDHTANTERVRLDSSGNLLVGTTNDAQDAGPGVKLKLESNQARCFLVGDSTAGEGFSMRAGGAYKFFVGYNGTVNATNTSIASISDERLKENITDLETGLSEVLSLKPRRFDWKEGEGSNTKNVAGFVAQEVETVLPDLIGGWKHDSLTDAKSVRMGDMLPTLVKAIQEQQEQIEQLKTEIQTLKGE